MASALPVNNWDRLKKKRVLDKLSTGVLTDITNVEQKRDKLGRFSV